MNCGVGLVAAGLFDPCTCVWQLVQLRACHKFTTFLPLELAVIAGCSCGGTAGAYTPGWPPTAPTVGPCGVWQPWHRIGGRDTSIAGIVLPCGLWQLAQLSLTG